MKRNMWTRERIAHLIRLQGDGLSAASISHALGNDDKTGQPIFSRNAVLGKLFRLGLSNLDAPKTPRKKPVRKPVPAGVKTKGASPQNASDKSLAIVPVIPAKRAANGKLLNVLSLTKVNCRWPIGNPGEEGFGFCGHHCAADKSYCDEHSAIAYKAVSKYKTGQYSYVEKTYIAKHWNKGSGVVAISKSLNRSPGSIKTIAADILKLRVVGEAA